MTVEVLRYCLNRPAFTPSYSLEPKEGLLSSPGLTAIVYSGSTTDVDTVLETVDKLKHAIAPAPNTSMKLIIAVPGETVTQALEAAGHRILRPESVMECINMDGLKEDFGVDFFCSCSGEAMRYRSGHSLIATMLFLRLAKQNSTTEAPQHMLVQGSRGLDDFPFRWMVFLQNKHQAIMTQEKQWHAANESLIPAAMALGLLRHGETGTEIYELLTTGWLGSSVTLTCPDVLGMCPNPTNIRAHDLALALSAAEFARKKRRPLVQIGRAYPDLNVSPSSDDRRLILYQSILHAFATVLWQNGIRLAEAKPIHWKTINRVLQQLEASYESDIGIGAVLPPIDLLAESGYIIEEKAQRLLHYEGEGGEIWSVTTALEQKQVPLEELLTSAGLVPDHRPERLGPLTTEIIKRIADLMRSGVAIMWEDQDPRARPVYSLFKDKGLDALLLELSKLMLYNTPTGDDGRIHPFDLMTPDMEPVRVQIEAYMRSANIRVLLPFAREPESLAGVLEYCSKVVGTDKIITIDAGKCAVSSRIAQQSKTTAIEQAEVLTSIDWSQMIKDGVLPADFRLEGSKALTLLAGLIELERQYQNGEIDDDTMILFHDTDIINPNEYAALHYLGLPLRFHPEGASPRTVQMAKSGPGRNNETIHLVISRYMNNPDPVIKKIGFAATLAWPLAGERGVRWGDLRNMIWTNAMGIESIIDIQQACLDAEDGICGTVEVANRIPKKENRPSLPKRELGMIFGLARFWQHVERAMTDLGNDKQARPVTEWGLTDIGIFNQKWGGAPATHMFADYEDHEHAAPYISNARTDYLIPSIAQLVENRYIAVNQHGQ